MIMKLTPALAILALAIALWCPRTGCAQELAPDSATTTPARSAATPAPTNKPPAQEATTGAAQPAPRQAAADLPNFHSVHPFLYRGGEPTAEGVKKLKELGVGTIIDLRAPTQSVADEARLARSLGIKTINLPMSSKAPTDSQVKKFMDAVQKAKDDPAAGKAFVHCAHGSDRTGCMVGIWRVVKDGWSYEDAYKEMRKYYFGPKFTNLSGAVQRYSQKTSPVAAK